MVRWGSAYAAACIWTEWRDYTSIDRGAVYVWEGDRWTLLGPESFVFDLEVVSDTLLAVMAHGVHRWSGSDWVPVPGTPSGISDLAVQGGDLWVGGGFTVAGSNVARGIAHYGSVPNRGTRDTVIGVLARPNPFSAGTAVLCDLPTSQHMRVTVHGIDGRRLITLWDGLSGPGERAVWWDGRDAVGRRVAAGTYWVRVGTASGRGSVRIVRIR